MLFAVFSGGDDDEGDRTTTATTATEATTIADAPESLTVAKGEPVGGVKRLT